MLLKELIRFSTQHRTLYCYMILTIWIFLLIAGMYKYITLRNTFSGFLNDKTYAHASISASSLLLDASENNADPLKFRQYKESCGPMEHLVRHDDGGILEGWKLQGVLLVIRHGDRGPYSYVTRPVTNVDCGITGNPLVNRYRSFLYNSTTSSSGANHMYWNKVGPFHGFPLLPATEKSCQLGQLTYKGIAQLLQVGDILHQIYAHPLGLLLKQAPNKSDMNSTPSHSLLLNSDEVVLFTTRYRRSFQSALAFLFSFLPVDKWLSLNARESHSMTFCFTDCTCAQAETLHERMRVLNAQHLHRHSYAQNILTSVGSKLLEYDISEIDLVVDAMLTVLCHDAPLPCLQSPNTTPSSSGIDLNDVINIDQDDTAANLVDDTNLMSAGAAASSDEIQQQQAAGVEGCIEPSDVVTLMSYAHERSSLEANHVYYKRKGLLLAYGMMRHIVSYMLKMISGDRTKFVLYSGHDHTLRFLTAALGINTGNTFIPYAARLAFELYKSDAHTDYYFRVVYNGRDVVKQIEFCAGGKSLRVTRDSRGNKADLCPIENIIRFLHEDYFAPLNATNFKDACTVP